MKILCEGLWKVFGDNSDQLISALKTNSLSDEEIYDQYNCKIAIKDVNLTIHKGELFVIMGLAGSGKSTLLRCFNRLVEPTKGKVLIDGECLNNMSSQQLREVRQKKMGMVFQHFALLPHKTVLDNVAYGLEIKHIPREERYKRARVALDLVNLLSWEQSYPKELSGGEQQCVELARALAVNPEILLMDEPFSGLDPVTRKQMQDEFLERVVSLKKTIVFITHDLNEALKLADRIAIIDNGKIVQIGTPQEIVLQPANDYVTEFVASVSRTKAISAQNVMLPPKLWICSHEETLTTVLQKMRCQQTDILFVTNASNRVLGQIRKETIGQHNKNIQEVMVENYPAVFADTPLEKLLPQILQYQQSIAVLDNEQHLLGVISTTSLLNGLSKVI